MAQCRAKVKVLRKKYKDIVDSLRRSGTGHESDEEVDIPTDFPYFDVMDAVLGSRASVTLVHLLDSTNSISQSIAEEEEPLNIIPSCSSTPLPSGSTNTVEPTPAPWNPLILQPAAAALWDPLVLQPTAAPYNYLTQRRRLPWSFFQHQHSCRRKE